MSKNLIYPCDQRTKKLKHPCKHWYPKTFFGLNKINYSKNIITNLQTNKKSTG